MELKQDNGDGASHTKWTETRQWRWCRSHIGELKQDNGDGAFDNFTTMKALGHLTIIIIIIIGTNGPSNTS